MAHVVWVTKGAVGRWARCREVARKVVPQKRRQLMHCGVSNKQPNLLKQNRKVSLHAQ